MAFGRNPGWGRCAGASVDVQWREITSNVPAFGATDPSTDRIGQYTAATCGDEEFETGDDATYAVSGNFKVELPTAGTLLPISTSSLLIAGISMNSMWMLPLMGAVVGVLVLFKVKRKQN